MKPNPLFELVTITPENRDLIIDNLEDEKEYDWQQIPIFGSKPLLYRSMGIAIKNALKQYVLSIYLPHQEEKKVSEDKILNIITDYFDYKDQNELDTACQCAKHIYELLSVSPPIEDKEMDLGQIKDLLSNLLEDFLTGEPSNTSLLINNIIELFTPSTSPEVSKKPLSNWDEIIERYKDETGRSVFATYAFSKWLNENYPAPSYPLREVSDEEIEKKYPIKNLMVDVNWETYMGNTKRQAGAKWMRDKLKGGNTK